MPIEKTFVISKIERIKESLEKIRILPKEFANKIGRSVGLRNRIVHQYEDVKPMVFVESLRKNIGDFDEYIRHILSNIK